MSKSKEGFQGSFRIIQGYDHEEEIVNKKAYLTRTKLII